MNQVGITKIFFEKKNKKKEEKNRKKLVHLEHLEHKKSSFYSSLCGVLLSF